MIAIACSLLLLSAERANAEITVISQPDAEYQEATTKIDISNLPDHQDIGDVLDFITDGTLTVTFDPPVYKTTVPVDWARWSSPPDSESATPAILVNEDLSLTMDLSMPVTTFGFELEANFEGPFDFRVDFVNRNGPNGPETVGTINLSLHNVCVSGVGGFCVGGARLFAASNEDSSGTGLPTLLPFDRIIITGGDYFAIAQIRYDVQVEDVEVEIDIMPGSSKNPIKLSRDRFIPVAILSNSDPSNFFDATTVVPSSVCFGDAEDPRQRGDCTEAHKTGHIEDVDGDGDLDLLLHFNTHETGIKLGDTQACLTGKTFSGVFFTACDTVEPKK
jgi:hypothetical protein